MQCYHCQESVAAPNDYQLSLDGNLVSFCCPACLAICETITDAKLDFYYRQRPVKAKKSTPMHYELLLSAQFQQQHVEYHDDLASCKFFIQNMHCTACAWLIEKHLKAQVGVEQASVNYQEQSLLIQWRHKENSLANLLDAVDHIGYHLHIYQSSEVYEKLKLQSKKMLQRLGVSFILMMQIGMLSIALYAGDFFGISPGMQRLLSVFSMAFALPALYFSATPFLSSALNALKNRYLNMDVSISLAIVGLFASSCYSILQQQGDIYFDSVVMLCFFILLSRYIELRSRLSLQQNGALLPSTAKRLIDNEIFISDAADIQAGDTLLIQPGDTIPLDGIVSFGQSSCSEALINGESNAVAKTIGDSVYAASHNHDGVLHITASAKQSEALASRMQKAADAKRLTNHKKLNLSDKISSKFTVIMLFLAVASFVYWYFAANPDAYWIALSVLVVSCPCALSLAAPTANSVAQKRLKDRGIFIQSENTLEALAGIRHICFDKTGTLTEGRIRIDAIENSSNLAETELLRIASMLEASSHHPISHAFDKSTKLADNVSLINQQGIEGSIDGQRYRIGSPSFCQQWHAASHPPASNNMIIGLCSEDSFIAWFHLQDPIRPNAQRLCEYMQANNFTLHILSGDSSNHVKSVAATLKIPHYYAGLSSYAKQDYVQNLQASGDKVLMLGDGINDAQVLAAADISATLFNASDWVRNTADIVFMQNDLQHLQLLFTAVKQHQKILRENYLWAFLYNGIAIPFAMAGFITPLLAAAGMSLSSVIVVLNSQRLKKARI